MSNNQNFVECCEMCQYSGHFDDNQVTCRRFPPTLQLNDNKLIPFIPTVYKSWWCGEFSPQQVQQE